MEQKHTVNPWRFGRETDLQVLSRERSGIFGLTILWIMFFHSSLGLPEGTLFLVKSTGYAGVDLFFFLSGIGLYYSMEKDANPLRFYKKRAFRVLLSFLAVALPYEGLRLYLGYITPADFWKKVTLTGYWLNGDMNYWFISAILVFYLVYPLLYRIIKRKDYAAQVLLITAAFALVRWLYEDQPLFYRWNGIAFRIPVFLVGCFLAPAVKEGRKLRTLPTLIACSGVVLFCYRLWLDCCEDWSWFLRMYIFLPLVIALALMAGILLAQLPEKNPLTACLNFLGGMTLELYLLHEKLLAGFSSLIFPNWAYTWQLNALVFALCVLLAWCLRQITRLISKKFLS